MSKDTIWKKTVFDALQLTLNRPDIYAFAAEDDPNRKDTKMYLRLSNGVHWVASGDRDLHSEVSIDTLLGPGCLCRKTLKFKEEYQSAAVEWLKLHPMEEVEMVDGGISLRYRWDPTKENSLRVYKQTGDWYCWYPSNNDKGDGHGVFYIPDGVHFVAMTEAEVEELE